MAKSFEKYKCATLSKPWHESSAGYNQLAVYKAPGPGLAHTIHGT